MDELRAATRQRAVRQLSRLGLDGPQTGAGVQAAPAEVLGQSKALQAGLTGDGLAQVIEQATKLDDALKKATKLANRTLQSRQGINESLEARARQRVATYQSEYDRLTGTLECHRTLP
jgi:hypothetical protein